MTFDTLDFHLHDKKKKLPQSLWQKRDSSLDILRGKTQFHQELRS